MALEEMMGHSHEDENLSYEPEDVLERFRSRIEKMRRYYPDHSEVQIWDALDRAKARIEEMEKAAKPVLLAVFDSMWTSSAKGEYSLASNYYDKLYDACRVLSAAIAKARPIE